MNSLEESQIIGKKIDKYKVKWLLGKGSYATVLLVEDPQQK